MSAPTTRRPRPGRAVRPDDGRAGGRRRSRTTIATIADRGVDAAGDRVDLEPAHRLERDVGRDRHQREEHERDDREDDARDRRTASPAAAIEGEAGQQDADRRDRRRRRPGACVSDSPRNDDRQHDRQPAERGDHAADDRDRAELEAGEVGEVGPGADDPEQDRQIAIERGSVGQRRPGDRRPARRR